MVVLEERRLVKKKYEERERENTNINNVKNHPFSKNVT